MKNRLNTLWKIRIPKKKKPPENVRLTGKFEANGNRFKRFFLKFITLKSKNTKIQKSLGKVSSEIVNS